MNTWDVEVDTKDVELMMERAARWMDDSHLSPFTRDAFGEIMRDDAQERFNTESNNGQAWEPLSAATMRRRIDQGYPGSHPINERSGRMKGFLVHSVPDGGSTGGQIEYEWPDAANGELFMKLFRAAGRDGRVPARPVVDMRPENVEDFVTRAFDDLERSMR